VPAPRLQTYSQRPAGETHRPTGARSTVSSSSTAPVSRLILARRLCSELARYRCPVAWLITTSHGHSLTAIRSSGRRVAGSNTVTDEDSMFAQ
jgi:hypothetical protein